MIGRLWHGWTRREQADDYEALLRGEVLPGIHRVDGYRARRLLARFDQRSAHYQMVQGPG